jgi:hypothetical protein
MGYVYQTLDRDTNGYHLIVDNNDNDEFSAKNTTTTKVYQKVMREVNAYNTIQEKKYDHV